MSQHRLFCDDYLKFTLTAEPVLPWVFRWLKVRPVTKECHIGIAGVDGSSVLVNVTPDGRELEIGIERE